MAATDETKPSEPVGESPKQSSFIDNFLKSPFSGIAPWIVLSVISSPGRFEEAAAAALGLSLLVLWLSHRRGIGVHSLEVFGVLVFAMFAVLGLVAPHNVIGWLELWAGEVTNISLAAFAVFTLLIRKPFTLAYAKQTTPHEYWESPLFLPINYAITSAWAAAFVFAAIVGAIGDAVLHDSGNFWTGWVCSWRRSSRRSPSPSSIRTMHLPRRQTQLVSQNHCRRSPGSSTGCQHSSWSSASTDGSPVSCPMWSASA